MNGSKKISQSMKIQKAILFKMNKAIILAGGKGTRLLPYTIVVPKPMLPIGEIPIIEIISKQLSYFGFNEVTVSLGHLSGMIQLFLESKKKEKGFPSFKFFQEDEPLGTSGPIKAISPIEENFLVINGDILTTLDMRKMFDQHLKEKACLTVGVRLTDYTLPLGSISVDENSNITSFIEKPKVTHLDNIGAYAYSTKVLDYINPGERIDVNILIDRLLKANEKVMAFRSDGPYYWIDIGTHADYEKANNNFSNIIKSMPYIETKG
jgi:NDP-sugar pyrophosphorylase family protein